MIYLYCSWKR